MPPYLFQIANFTTFFAVVDETVLKFVKQADIKKEKEDGVSTGAIAKKKTKKDLDTDELDSIGFAEEVDPLSLFEDG